MIASRWFLLTSSLLVGLVLTLYIRGFSHIFEIAGINNDPSSHHSSFHNLRRTGHHNETSFAPDKDRDDSRGIANFSVEAARTAQNVAAQYDEWNYSQGEATLWNLTRWSLSPSSASLKSDHRPSVSQCSYSRKLERRVYTHRSRRKNELTTLDLWRVVQSEAMGDGGYVEFAPSIPPVVNPPPVALSFSGDLSVPFGSWKTWFLPADSDIRRMKPPQLVPAEPPLYVALFRTALLHLGHVVSCGGKLYTAGGCLWSFSLSEGAREAAASRPLVPIGVPLCDEWCRGFYHFTHEHLPRIAAVHRLLLTNNRSFLVLSHSPNSFQRQFFVDVLGIDPARIIHGPVYTSLAVYPMPLRCGNTFTHLLHMIRGIVFQRLALNASSVPISPQLLQGRASPSLRGKKKGLPNAQELC